MTRCPERDSFGNQCNREKGHGGNHESTCYEREKMTYTDWLRDELPKVLAGTEYWKDATILNLRDSVDIEHEGIYLYIRIPISRYDNSELEVDSCVFDYREIQVIAEACSLITTIEAKRRELS